MQKIKNVSELDDLRESILRKRDPDKQIVKVCCSTGCRAGGSLKIIEAFKHDLAGHGLEDIIEIRKTGCRGSPRLSRRPTPKDQEPPVSKHFASSR